MKEFKYVWIIGLVLTLLIVAVPIAAFISTDNQPANDPWIQVPVREPHVDHTDLQPVIGPGLGDGEQGDCDHCEPLDSSRHHLLYLLMAADLEGRTADGELEDLGVFDLQLVDGKANERLERPEG